MIITTVHITTINDLFFLFDFKICIVCISCVVRRGYDALRSVINIITQNSNTKIKHYLSKTSKSKTKQNFLKVIHVEFVASQLYI